MESTHSVLIVLPAFNEATVIADVIERITAEGYSNILVVDDCSTDNTAAVVRRCNVNVISLPYNMGAWKATQTGIRYALKNGFSTIVTIDADGQHKASEIKKLIDKRNQGNDLVIGSCISRGSKGRLLTWKLLRFLGKLELNDLTSGFRCYSRAAIVALSGKRATMLDYQDIGVIFLLKHCGLRCTEVQVQMSPRKNGISRIFHSWLAVFSYLTYTFILTITKALPFILKKYRLQVLEEGRRE